MRALGLDLGTKTMGIAISDSLKIIASGLENFEYRDNDLSICINKLKEVFDKYQNDIDIIVLGHPKGLNNQKTEMTMLVEKFHSMLEQSFKGIKIIYWDERFSTVNTTSMLKFGAGLKASKIKKIKDKMSAVYILQDWIDNHF